MDKDRIAGTAKDVAGKVEGGLGDITGDQETQASGRVSLTARRNASPSAALATTSWPASSRSRMRPLRSRTESSATATRMGAPPR